MVKSVRIDPTLAARVQRAARIRRMTESEFMREAIERGTREALENDDGSFYERTRHLILQPSETAGLTATPDVGDLIAEKHARIVDGYRQRRRMNHDAAPG